MMVKEPAVLEQELEKLFKTDPKYAVQMLDSYYRENIWRYIKSICRRFDDEDIHSVYQKTLHEFIQCVRKPDFDPKSPLRLVQRIAKLRAIDRARRKDYRLKFAGDLIEPLAVDLKDSKINLEWKLVLKEEWPRFRRTLEEAIRTLPQKQQTAATAFLEVYEEIRREQSPRPLARRIIEMTGEDCTTAQATDNWREAKKKLQEILTRAGFRALFEEYL